AHVHQAACARGLQKWSTFRAPSSPTKSATTATTGRRPSPPVSHRRPASSHRPKPPPRCRRQRTLPSPTNEAVIFTARTHHRQASRRAIRAAHHVADVELIPDPSRPQADVDHSGHTRRPSNLPKACCCHSPSSMRPGSVDPGHSSCRPPSPSTPTAIRYRPNSLSPPPDAANRHRPRLPAPATPLPTARCLRRLITTVHPNTIERSGSFDLMSAAHLVRSTTCM
ncbi:hypothetical protein ACLOJK_018751, partial [Asimina triloba]